MRRAAAALAGVALAGASAAPAGAAPCRATARPDRSVPTWERVNGFRLGARPATPQQIDAYMLAVDRASRRVRTVLAGSSSDGRPLRYAIVGTPANLAPARLERLAAGARAARAGTLSAPAAARFARDSPAFVWVAGGVHGNEPSGADADMALLARLAAGRSCAAQRRLRRLVIFLMADQNPDGRAAGTHVDAQRFDLNRDWFAVTQPETAARLDALARYPPTVFVDQHEESGADFFFPPNADPVHHEVPPAALRTINDVVAPALRRAFAARGLPYTNYATYDLFFMGYGDTVPSTLFGAAGMTFEKGGATRYADKVAQHLLAAEATLSAVAAARADVLRRWALQWRAAATQGARGVLAPNRVQQPGNVVRFQVPRQRVYGYAIAGAPHAGDAAALAARLVRAGVRVLRLRAPLAVAALRRYGSLDAGPATLAPGSYYVPMAQAAKHWVEAMLGEDAYVPFPYFYDVASWSNPLLMGLEGGAVQAPPRVPGGAADPVALDDAPAQPAEAAPAYAFAGDSQAAAEAAFALLRAGAAVSRRPDGTYVTTADRTTAVGAAAQRRVALAALAAVPADAVALRLPRVAILGDTAADAGAGGVSGGWATWLLRDSYGLDAATLSAGQLTPERLAGLTALVVPDGEVGLAGFSPAALAALQGWVRAGGTLIAWRGRGLAIAQAAGVTAVRAIAPPAGFMVPGAQLRTELDPSDPVAWGEGAQGWAFDAGDPILDAGTARVVARYPAGESFRVSGYTSGADALRGSAAVTDELVGTGRVVLFGFDPVFRGYVEGGERLVANALLAPPPPAPPPAAARRARPLDPSALLAAPPPHRDAAVQVAAGDEAALLAAARAAGVPAGFTVERDLETVTLRVPNPAGLDAAQRPWTRRLPGALAAAGVRPLLAAF